MIKAEFYSLKVCKTMPLQKGEISLVCVSRKKYQN